MSTYQPPHQSPTGTIFFFFATGAKQQQRVLAVRRATALATLWPTHCLPTAMEAFAYDPKRQRVGAAAPDGSTSERPQAGAIAASLRAGLATGSASSSTPPANESALAGGFDAAKGTDAGSIRSMGGATALRICSDQVVVDLRSALKELVENALDAGATRIEVKLKEHGAECLEVSDNGAGIAQTNLAGVAQRHHTSKLRDFDDLGKLRSFGFRGEALSSLAALSTLSVSTRTKDEQVGACLTFGRDGSVASRTTVRCLSLLRIGGVGNILTRCTHAS